MRNVTAVIATLLLTSSVGAETVDMLRPHIQYLADLNAPCKLHKRGCTIIAADFFCGCAESGGKWTAHPHLVARPAMYLMNQDVLRHELLHIADITASLKTYAASLLLRSFDSEKACTTFVEGEAKLFAHTLALIQRDTTIRRDGIRYAGPID
jgi:hypothetical protein